MTFDRNGLAKLGTANSDAGSFWIYRSTDLYAEIDNADYFLNAINELKRFDGMLVISGPASTAVATLTYVATNDGSTITIAAGNTVTA
jgi:hypothetical protein